MIWEYNRDLTAPPHKKNVTQVSTFFPFIDNITDITCSDSIIRANFIAIIT
jgi:hypothetical protein